MTNLKKTLNDPANLAAIKAALTAGIAKGADADNSSVAHGDSLSGNFGKVVVSNVEAVETNQAADPVYVRFVLNVPTDAGWGNSKHLRSVEWAIFNQTVDHYRAYVGTNQFKQSMNAISTLGTVETTDTTHFVRPLR